jgi:hypothetical protein
VGSFFDYSVGSEFTRPEGPKGEAGLLEVAATHDSRLRSSSRDLLSLSLSRSLDRRRESYVRSQGFSMLEDRIRQQFLEKIEHEVARCSASRRVFSTNSPPFPIAEKSFISTPFGKAAKMPKNMTAQRCRR